MNLKLSMNYLKKLYNNFFNTEEIKIMTLAVILLSVLAYDFSLFKNLILLACNLN
jgi:hypothetical protein